MRLVADEQVELLAGRLLVRLSAGQLRIGSVLSTSPSSWHDWYVLMTTKRGAPTESSARSMLSAATPSAWRKSVVAWATSSLLLEQSRWNLTSRRPGKNGGKPGCAAGSSTFQ